MLNRNEKLENTTPKLSLTDELRKLAELLDKGVISDREFDKLKSKIVE